MRREPFLKFLDMPGNFQAAAIRCSSLAQTTAQSQMGDAEKTHAEKTAAIGRASLQMADIAMDKVTHPKVFEFAKFEHDELARWSGRAEIQVRLYLLIKAALPYNLLLIICRSDSIIVALAAARGTRTQERLRL